MSEEQKLKLKNAAKKVGNGTKGVAKFWTENSKKLTLVMLFLISVIVNEAFLDNTLYPKNELFESNLFKAILIAVCVITVQDIKGLINKFLEKYTR